MQNATAKKEMGNESVADWRTLPGFSELFAYWQSMRQGDGLPQAEDFDLLALTPWLPEMSLLDLNGPNEIVCRFIGTAIVERMGNDLSQKDMLPEHADETRERAHKAYLALSNLPCAAVARYSNHYSAGQAGVIRTLYLPMTRMATGANSRIVCISTRESRLKHAAPIKQTIAGTEISSIDWIDLGFGIPDNTH